MRGSVLYPYIPHYRSGVFEQMDALRDYEFHFVAGREGVDGIRTFDPAKVRQFTPVSNRYFGGLLWQKGLLDHIRRTRPEFVIVLADFRAISSTLVAIWCKLNGVPVFFWTHGWTRTPTGFRDLVKRAYFALCDSLLLYGNNARLFGLEAGIDDSKMSVIYNSIEESRVCVPLDSENLMVRNMREFSASHTPIIGAVARLQPTKSLHLIIEAAAKVKAKNPEYSDIGVLLIGDGPERENLNQLAQELNVPLLSPGASYEPLELSCFYETVDITIIPDRVGLTGVQSMSFGVPVVSNDSVQGQMPEWEAIRPGETGNYFPSGDADGLSTAIVKILRGPSLREQCENEYASRWSPVAQAHRIELALNRFLRNT